MTTNQTPFHNEAGLSEAAVDLGKKALQLGLISSFAVRYFPDSQQFDLSDDSPSDPLTPEQAYMRLKQLVEQSGQ